MVNRIKVVEIELSRPIASIAGLDGYHMLQGLVRLRGVPLGYIYVSVSDGSCSAQAIVQAIVPQYTEAIRRELVRDRLAFPESDWQVTELLNQATLSQQAALADDLPLVTVAFCPRQTTDLNASLAALQKLEYPHLEVLVVETTPTNHALEQLIQAEYPAFHYIGQPEAGLNRSRNLAIAKAQGDIIAFTDEHGIVDVSWIRAIATTFIENPEVMAVTGLVVPNELETEAQFYFDQGYGFARGFDRQWWQLDANQKVAWTMLGTMQLGTETNMAFRRSLFEKIGAFNPGLDLEDVTWGGGDLDLFCRVLLSGQTLIYEPSVVVRYRAPQAYAALRSQVAHSIIGLYAYLAAGTAAYPKLRSQFTLLGLWKLARLLMSLLRPYSIPRDLIWAELQAIWSSWGRYGLEQTERQSGSHLAPTKLMAVRTVDLSQGLSVLDELADYRATRVFVRVGATLIGSVDIANHGHMIGVGRLRQAIADQLGLELLAIPYQRNLERALTEVQAAIRQHFTPAEAIDLPTSLPIEVPVSIVITTCDRPDDLANCLWHLTHQQTERELEIIVADNRPTSGLTPPVVAQFPGVKLVSESRKGSAYGRNAAIAASTGEIIVTVDDDVTVPLDWLEKLVAPLVRPEVMAVTGNVLPRELETPAQVLFEQVKGGLGQGFKPFEADGAWLASFRHCSPPTWELGVSANSAFRASIFCHPKIGLMYEVLGPGTPTAGAEENHLVYKILKAGYTLVYEPKAYVWHKHRRDLSGFYRQIYGQMKSGTAYHLTLWLHESDDRGLRQVVFELPRYYLKRIYARLRGRHHTPWMFLWQEVRGYIAGYWAYWHSCQLVKRHGHSSPYIPVSDRLMSESPSAGDSSEAATQAVASQGNAPQSLTVSNS